MQMDEEVIDVSRHTVGAAEQQTPGAPGKIARPPKPRGRPWVKGQSGNPRGRPSRARQAAYVTDALIARQAVPLTNKFIEVALGGDRTTLRACVDRISPPRREPPIDLQLPETIDTRAALLAALTAIADATAAGALTSSQAVALTRMLIDLRQATW
jgi:hypothetical protein